MEVKLNIFTRKEILANANISLVISKYETDPECEETSYFKNSKLKGEYVYNFNTDELWNVLSEVEVLDKFFFKKKFYGKKVIGVFDNYVNIEGTTYYMRCDDILNLKEITPSDQYQKLITFIDGEIKAVENSLDHTPNSTMNTSLKGELKGLQSIVNLIIDLTPSVIYKR